MNFDSSEKAFLLKASGYGFEVLEQDKKPCVRLSQFQYILEQSKRQEFKPQLHYYA